MCVFFSFWVSVFKKGCRGGTDGGREGKDFLTVRTTSVTLTFFKVTASSVDMVQSFSFLPLRL